jgi:Domain of unknown function (DUF4412)
MKTIRFLVLSVVAALAAHADFSYTTVSKSPAGERTSKHYIKSQKMITDDGDRVTIMDLDAQTMTTINKTQKTYSVRPFSELYSKSGAAGMNVNADIKKTGQHKNINGFDAEEMVVTMAMDNSQSKQPGAKMQMQMEMHIWFASDVPGINEAHAFYEKNADRMPWPAMAGGNTSMAEIQHKMATMHGIPVLTVMKMGGANPQQQAQMDQARARIEEMKKQGGPQAAMADQMLARMGGGSSDITNESSGFSASPVPDSVFAIPADYQKVDK